MPRSQEELERLLFPTAEEISGKRPSSLRTMKGDASSRRYHRLDIPDGKPASLVVMELPIGPTKSDEASKPSTNTELPFLNVHRYLSKQGLRVPQVLLYDADDGILFLEDLGDATFETMVRPTNGQALIGHYERALTLLVDMQQRTTAPDDTCIAFSRAFDEELLLWELHHFREWLLEADRKVTLDASERAIVDDQFGHIAKELARLPRRFVHRDFQSRNLMVVDNHNLALIDFQDALLGPPFYDAVALLRDSYVELTPAALDHLINFYFNTSSLNDISRARSGFFLQAVQRKLKDAGRFVFIDKVKGNPDFLQWIPSSLRYVKHGLGQLPQLAPLARVLGKHVDELQGISAG